MTEIRIPEVKPPEMDCEKINKKFQLKDNRGDMVQYGIEIAKNMSLSGADRPDFFCRYVYIPEEVAKVLGIWMEFKPLDQRSDRWDCYVLTDEQRDKQHSFFPSGTGGLTYRAIHQIDEWKTLVLGYDQNHYWNDCSNFYGSWTNEFALLKEIMEDVHRAYCQTQHLLTTNSTLALPEPS